jgi:predicted Fe-S protein YdhL (DUF1289 family)
MGYMKSPCVKQSKELTKGRHCLFALLRAHSKFDHGKSPCAALCNVAKGKVKLALYLTD